MLGRAIQLTLPYQTPGDSSISDSQSAQDYLNDILPDHDINKIRELNQDGSYLWGNLPYDLGEDLRIINLEAAPTVSIDNPDIPEKSIHYHVNIKNLHGIFSHFVNPYVLCLANNHSMDMGRTAFIQETLRLNEVQSIAASKMLTLPMMSISSSQAFNLPNIPNAVGIGINKATAYAPKIIGNIAIFAFGAGCAGVPSNWRATDDIAGVAYLPPIHNELNVNISFEIIKESMQRNVVIEGKCVVISIHWGPNVASVNDGQQYRERLAHRLIDELGVDLIHGHSSHHIRGIELYKGKLILYGAGDFVNDYEDIPSSYDKAGALYIVDLDRDYIVTNLTFIPFETRKLQCIRIKDPDRVRSLRAFVNKQSIRDTATPLII